MKVSKLQMNAILKIKQHMNNIWALELTACDCPKDSEDYKEAIDFLTSPLETLANEITEEVTTSLTKESATKNIKFVGKDFINKIVLIELKRADYPKTEEDFKY